MPQSPPNGSEILLYRTEDGRVRVDVRFEGDTVWLTQANIAQLYQTTPQNITMHIAAVYDEGELSEAATCKKYLQVRDEGGRRVQRNLKHYSLTMILAVGYRVRSTLGTAFRQWATARLEEYVRKGFTLDDARLKNPPGPGVPDYFDELLERIRDIRSSEKVFWKKTLDIYATSVDYDPNSDTARRFFKTVQNKMHWAAHGHTAAELIVARADASKENLGLTSWARSKPRKADAAIAKNYLTAEELDTLNRIVTAYLEFAELQALNRRPMTMADWVRKLDDFLRLGDRAVLTHAGSVSHAEAVAKAKQQFEMFAKQRSELPSAVEEDFEQAVRSFEKFQRGRPVKRRSSNESSQ